jgi:hypothetical protein
MEEMKMKQLLSRTGRTWSTVPLAAALTLVTVAPEGRAGTDVVFAGTSSGRIHQIDIGSGDIFWTRQIGGTEEAAIRALEASEDGLFFVVGSSNAVALFSTQGAELYVDWGGTPLGSGVDGSHLVEQTQVAIDSTGQTFAAALSNGSMRIYQRVGATAASVWTSGDYSINSVAMNEDGTTVIGAGSIVYVAKCGVDGVWNTADDSYYTYDHTSWSGKYLNVDVSWNHYANEDPYVVVGSSSSGQVMVFQAGDSGTSFKWLYDNPRGGIMSVGIDKAPNYVVAANDDPTDSNGAEISVFDPETGNKDWTFTPGSNGGNDFRSIDVQWTANSYTYFASGGSGQATVFEHGAASSTKQWEGSSVGERDRITYLLWDQIITCDITKPKVVIYDSGGGSNAVHQVTTDGNCRAISATSVPFAFGIPYCFGDGSGTSCPCGNPGDPDHGCANGQYVSGARLDAVGTASLSDDTLILHCSNTNNSQAGLYFQANNNLSPGIPWGDGLMCAGGQLKRLGVRFSNGTGNSNTSGWATTISQKAGNVYAGDTKYYQLWYRDMSGGQPCGVGVNDFNTSNGMAITWTP